MPPWTLSGKSRNFNPLPPHGGRLHAVYDSGDQLRFQSTPSAWRETPVHVEDTVGVLFQSTPSAWRETPVHVEDTVGVLFQSTPSAWRETRYCNLHCLAYIISIHSLRMEGDQRESVHRRIPGISIHSLRMEGDSTALRFPR